MPRVLILSSYVASSRVGGGAQALALARLGIEPILVPTVLLGRHPGHGVPGGGPVSAEVFEAMIGAVEAQGLFPHLDAVITGHFSAPEQVAIAADALGRIKIAAPATRLVIDPIMGDADKGLYVREAVAESIARLLVPPADLLAPNVWELARLTGHAADDAAGALAAARSLDTTVIASSMRRGGEIGVLYAAPDEAWLAWHAAHDAAPKGTGDLLTALVTAALAHGMSGREALDVAVGGVAEAVAAAEGLEELAVTSFPAILDGSHRVTIEALGG